MDKIVAILGGTGRMGCWFSIFFKKKGYGVIISGRTPDRANAVAKKIGVDAAASNSEAAAMAEIVVVATPIENTAETIREVKSRLRPGTIIFDIASVKGNIPYALKEAESYGARAISMHPLFGPGATSLVGKRVIIIPISDDSKLTEWAAELFREEGAEIHIVPSWEKHDQMVALTLSLTHFINIAFARVLTKTDIRDVKRFGGTTFTLQLALTEAILTEDPRLYHAIEALNPAFKTILEEFIQVAVETSKMIGDEERFIKAFYEARDSVGKDPDFANAYRRFYKAVDTLGR
jgi:prephenate dehydrogenase